MKRKLSILIIMCMLSICLYGISFTTSAAATITGTGTESDPYLIDSQEDFAAISGFPYYGEKYYKVTNDFSITLVSINTWNTELGDSYGNPFKGHLYGQKADGSMPVITLNINATSSFGWGLFRKMIGGTIENIKLDGTLSAIGDRTGGFVGWSTGGTIRNCINSVDVTATANQRAGGFVGMSDTGGTTNIENCINEGTISGVGASVGGIIGDQAISGGTSLITNCVNKGVVKTTTNNGNGVGGIAGITKGNISNCTNYGSVTSAGHLGGGIAGILNTGTIENCANYGTISVDYTYAGGIVASMTGTVNKCFNYGNILKATDGVGGIAGGSRSANSDAANCAITNCYNAGNIYGTGYVAGIVDVLGKSATTAVVTLTNNYNIGSVSASTLAKTSAVNRALDGAATKVATASGNYCLDTVYSATTAKTNAISKTSAQLMDLSNLTGFSDTVWAIIYSDNTNDNFYPQLIGNWEKDITTFEEITPFTVEIQLNKPEGNGGTASGKSINYVKEGSTFGFTVTPDSGYKFTVTLGSAPLYTDVLTETNITTSAITDNSIIIVSFELAPLSSPKVDGYNQVFTQNDAIIINEGTEYEATISAGAKGITFGRLYIVTGYTATEWGMAFSKTAGVLDNEANITENMRYKSSIPAAANGQLYGILFYGEGIKSSETYYTRPYAIYYDGTDYVTVYGAVTTFTPGI